MSISIAWCRAGQDHLAIGCIWNVSLMVFITTTGILFISFIWNHEIPDKLTPNILPHDNILHLAAKRLIIYPAGASVDVVVDRVSTLVTKRGTRRRIPPVVLQDPVLPRELCDAVIKQLRDDRQSLLMCSRVCWRWVAMSRCYLRINLLSADQAQAFGHLLRSPHETLSTHIRQVEFYDKYSIYSQHQRVLSVLRRRHTRLTSASLLSASLLGSLQSFSNSLTELRFIGQLSYDDARASPAVRLRLFEQRYYHFFAHASHFRSLHLLHLDIMNQPVELPEFRLPSLTEIKEFPPIQVLEVTGWNSDIVACLARNCRSLTTLEITSESPLISSISLQSLLRGSKDTLEDVKLLVVVSVNLAALSKLHIFRMCLSMAAINDGAKTLTSLTGNPNLRIVTIARSGSGPPIGGLDGSGADEEVSEPLTNALSALGVLSSQLNQGIWEHAIEGRS